MSSESNLEMSTSAFADLIRRICDHLGIAFSANRVFPTLADLSQDRVGGLSIGELNAVGQNFGFRFREMSGSIRDIVETVHDSGLVLLQTNPKRLRGGLDPELRLILGTKSRGRLEIYSRGSDRTISVRELRHELNRDEREEFRWLLIQPMLAAENASRFHYQTGTHSEPLKPVRRWLAFLKPESRNVRAVLIFSVIIGLLSLTTPLAVEAVVNTIAFGKFLQPLIILSLIVFVFLGFRAGLNVLMTIVTEIIQRKLFVRTVEDLSYRLTRVPLSTWNKYHGPELVNRFFDIVNIQKITSKLLLDTLMLVLQTIIGLTVLAFYHPFLLGYDIGLLAMMTIVLWFIGRGAVKTAVQESQLKYETAAWLQEIARHPSTFRFNGGLGFAINRADELAAKYINCRQGHFRILLRQITFAAIVQVLAATVLLALGGYLVIEAQMTLGQLVAAELIVTVILGSFAKLGKDLESFYDLMASVDKLGKLFDLPTEPFNRLQIAKRPGAYGLTLVDFQLDSSNALPTNLEISAKATVAVCGATELVRGQLLETLVGQIRPFAGHVLLDDYRVDSISSESLQEKLSFIREIEVFEGTVDENFRMGRENIGSHQVNDLVHKLGLGDTIEALPEGYETSLRISGYPLSHGQAIRLMLARALISKPGILFIDGLLDRLSDEDTADVLSRLDQFKVDTTMIISTGRQLIAEWADSQLDMSDVPWKLSKYEY